MSAALEAQVATLEAEVTRLRGTLAGISLASRRTDSSAADLVRQMGCEAHAVLGCSADAQVEGAAIAMWEDEAQRAMGRCRGILWSSENPRLREQWRRAARVALTAAPVEPADAEG